MWIDNYKIRIVNIEGVEKVLDVHNNMEQISYGTVPMLIHKDYVRVIEDDDAVEKKYDEEKEGHYFFDHVDVDISDIEKKLRMKYQDYFRAYFVDNKKTPD